jgi:hypothetical protein
MGMDALVIEERFCGPRGSATAAMSATPPR